MKNSATSHLCRLGAFLALLLGGLACAPAAQPSPAPAKPVPTAAPAKAAAPAQPAAAAKPAEKAPAQPDWQAEWDRTVAAGKREGRLVLATNPTDAWRNSLMTFQEEYPEIQVELTGLFGRDLWPRIYTEREAGQYLWDVRVGGSDNFDARDRGILEPIPPALILPEVKDESKWLGGREGLYDDKDKQYFLSFQAYIAWGIYVNRDTVPESDFNKVTELLNPRWKGKLTLQDPRGAAGLAHISNYYHVYGEDFIRDLMTKQDIVVTGDSRQQVEWAIRDRYPIGVGLSQSQLASFQAQGLGFNVKPVKDTGTLSTGTGGLQLFTRAPHPNAAKVFANWILTPKVQQRISAAIEANSRRVDLPPVDPETAPDPRLLSQYVANQIEEFNPIRDRARQFTLELVR